MENMKAFLKDGKLKGDPADLLDQAMHYLLLTMPILDAHAEHAAKTHPKDVTPKLFAKDVRKFLRDAGVKDVWA